MKNKFTLACLVSLLVLSGCSFDEVYLGVSCPGTKAVDRNASLNYILLSDGTVCKAESCTSIESCCSLHGKDAKIVFEAFDHGKCPADTLFATCHQDLKGLWFCGDEQEVCKPGFHLKGDECVMDTISACGAEGVSCDTENTRTVECAWNDITLSAECVIHECLPNYHNKDNHCIADTETACGVKETNCTKLEGTSCILGECLGKCDNGEDWCIDTCYNFASLNIQSCSSDGMVCAPRFADWDEDKSNGCEINLDDIHVQDFTITMEPKVNNTDPDEPGTDPDEPGTDPDEPGTDPDEPGTDPDEPGTDSEMVKVIHINCVSGYANWDSDVINGCETTLADVHVATWNPNDDTIQCVNGFADCDAIHSAAIHDIAANGCEADLNTPETCGLCDVTCNPSQVCLNQKCEINTCSGTLPDMCLDSEHQRVCVNVRSTDANNCGSCGHICANHPTATATSSECLSGVCQYTCKPEYTQCSTGVTADSISCILTSSMQTDNYNCGGCGDSATGEHICASDESCVAGVCKKNTCNNSQTLCGLGDCRTTNSDDAENCGACGYICSEHPIDVATSNSCLNGVCQYTCPADTHLNCGGSVASSLKCVSIASMNYDNNNCGGCGNTSTGEHICQSDESCIDGSCQVNTCLEGQTLCGINDGVNDCRTTNDTDVNNCGFCDYKCAEHPTSSAISNSCSGGKCQYQCNATAGYTQCGGGQTADSIICIHEDTFNTDRNNCGGCGDITTGAHICASGEVCVNGSCVTNSCSDTTLTLCSTTSGNECINVKSDLTDNCGSCGYTCADHLIGVATSNTCLNGVCQYSCPGDYQNCGTGITESTIMCILESSMQYDNYHCGNCSTVCKSDESCVKGTCEKNDCGDTTLCGIGDCRDTTSDADNCGACDYKCADHPTSSAISNSCSAGKCQYQCDATKGYTQCGGGQTADSIICIHENTFKTDRNNCGGCGNVSTGAHICQAGEVCVNGSCVTNSCTDTALTLCSTPSGNQCINVKSNDAYNCGSCGYTCANHSIGGVATSNTCLNGVCQYSCPSDTHENCGGNTAESVMCVSTASMQYDNYHCGNCTTVCASNESCVAGVCKKNTCSDGLTLCGLGDCRDTKTNLTNCGACNYSCAANAPVNTLVSSCTNGVCQYSCKDTTYYNKGTGNTASTIYCVPIGTPTCCGSTCVNCTAQNTSTDFYVCQNSACVKSNCANGQITCDNKCIDMDDNNCGFCGHKCDEALEHCVDGVCTAE